MGTGTSLLSYASGEGVAPRLVSSSAACRLRHAPTCNAPPHLLLHPSGARHAPLRALPPPSWRSASHGSSRGDASSVTMQHSCTKRGCMSSQGQRITPPPGSSPSSSSATPCTVCGRVGRAGAGGAHAGSCTHGGVKRVRPQGAHNTAFLAMLCAAWALPGPGNALASPPPHPRNPLCPSRQHRPRWERCCGDRRRRCYRRCRRRRCRTPPSPMPLPAL